MIVERVIEKLIRKQVDNDEMQFGFKPEWCTRNEKTKGECLVKKKNFYFVFAELEKTFDCMHRDVYGRL